VLWRLKTTWESHTESLNRIPLGDVTWRVALLTLLVTFGIHETCSWFCFLFTILTMKFRVFWDVLPCSQTDVGRRFRSACCLHNLGGSNSFWIHGIISQKTLTVILASVRTWNLTNPGYYIEFKPTIELHSNISHDVLGSLVVSVLAIVLKVHGFKPAGGDWFLGAIKSAARHLLRGSNAVGPMSYEFTVCWRTLRSVKEILHKVKFIIFLDSSSCLAARWLCW
jgi:hypothetical protein